MNSIAVFLLFFGIILIVNGYYKQKYNNCTKGKTIVKYVPRTLYEENLSDSEKLNSFYSSIFESVQPNFFNDKIN
jgi:hypothetical protein